MWAKEAMEAERLNKMQKIEDEENAAANDLALAIQNRNRERADQANNFFDSLIDKYAKKATKTTSTNKKKVTTKKTTKRLTPVQNIKKTKRKT
ncbi:J domain-containing protein CG6693 [Vespula squamosa]|uniref:J domain-containing protein CG6693 n=1 Tax=Vespula squamosa TaxID=30214 RepID=A0ABD2A3D8_VESSQ